MFRIKDERFPHKWGFSLRFNEASTLPGSSESSHMSWCRPLWRAKLVKGLPSLGAQSLPSLKHTPLFTQEPGHIWSPASSVTGHITANSLLLCSSSCWEPLLGLNSGFQNLISSHICPSSSNAIISTVCRSTGGGPGDAHKARFRHLQKGVLSTLPLPGVLLISSRSLPAQQPYPGPTAEARGTQGSVLSSSTIPLLGNKAMLPF